MAGTLLALRGAANRGKSTTIKKVYELLTSRYKNAHSEKLKGGVDIKVVITIAKTKIGIESQGDPGRKVGIESQGDPGSRLEDSLKDFRRRKCKVIVCATRTRGKTVHAVDSLQKEYRVIWFEQGKAKSLYEKANQSMAKKIFAAVQKALNG